MRSALRRRSTLLLWAAVLSASAGCYLLASALEVGSLPVALLSWLLYFAVVALPLGLLALHLLEALVRHWSPSDL